MQTQIEGAGVANSGRVATRQRSSISFPYNALPDITEIPQKIHQNVGNGECSDAQLAAWVGISPKASTFRVRISSARTFGLIEQGQNDDHRLTDLGRRFIDERRMRDARVESFLTVPLYRAIFDHYENGTIPPAAALERQIAEFGVAEKQKSRARAALEKSAEYAGFYEHGRNRLVKPGQSSLAEAPAQVPAVVPSKSGGGGDSFDHDPMVLGLFKRLPRPDDSWALHERQRWLQTAAQVFDLIYGDEDDGRIVVTVARDKAE